MRPLLKFCSSAAFRADQGLGRKPAALYPVIQREICVYGVRFHAAPSGASTHIGLHRTVQQWVGRAQRSQCAASRWLGRAAVSTPGPWPGGCRTGPDRRPIFLPGAVRAPQAVIYFIGGKGQPLQLISACPSAWRPPGQPARIGRPSKPGIACEVADYLGAIFQHRYLPKWIQP